MRLEPWNANLLDKSFEEWAKPVLLNSVALVRYVVPLGEDWPSGHQALGTHEIDMAVQFQTQDDRSLIFSWSMNGIEEGVALEQRLPGEADDDLFGSPVDVSQVDDWNRLIPIRVFGLEPVWHIPNEGAKRSPCAFRVLVGVGHELVISLGKIESGRPTYIPDGLLVFFDPVKARNYLASLNSIVGSGLFGAGFRFHARPATGTEVMSVVA